MKKNLVLLALVGVGAYFLLTRRRAPVVQVNVKELPTDSMAAGVMPGAVQGRIKDRHRQSLPQPAPMSMLYY